MQAARESWQYLMVKSSCAHPWSVQYDNSKESQTIPSQMLPELERARLGSTTSRVRILATDLRGARAEVTI